MTKYVVTTQRTNTYVQMVEADSKDAAIMIGREHSLSDGTIVEATTDVRAHQATAQEIAAFKGTVLPEKK